jgi:hypothetical protein
LNVLVRRRDVVALAAAFVLSRLVLVLAGFHFDTGIVSAAVQNVHPELLRTHLLQSLWYLHGQPPLWNALIGISFHISPGHWAQLWHGAFLVLGLVELLALYALQAELGVPRRLAAATAIAFSLTPAVILYENYCFYDYPTLVALTLVVLGAVRFGSRPSVLHGSLLFGAGAYLVLTRTLFQVWWLVVVLVVVLVACRGRRRLVLATAAIPFALVLAVYAKNLALNGVPSTTSWTGMSVARVAVMGLGIDERRRLVAEGKLHSVSLVSPLAPLANYEAVGIRLDPPSGIPLLDAPSGRGGARNLENRTYIRISRLYWHDDLWIIRNRPGAYLRSVLRGMKDFFTSPTIPWTGPGNAAHVHNYDRWFDDAVYGTLGRGRVGFFLVAAYVLAFGYGIFEAARRLRPGASPAVVGTAVATLTILYVTVVGNTAEVGENFRFQFALDPLVLVLCTAALCRFAQRRSLRSL